MIGERARISRSFRASQGSARMRSGRTRHQPQLTRLMSPGLRGSASPAAASIARARSGPTSTGSWVHPAEGWLAVTRNRRVTQRNACEVQDLVAVIERERIQPAFAPMSSVRSHWPGWALESVSVDGSSWTPARARPVPELAVERDGHLLAPRQLDDGSTSGRSCPETANDLARPKDIGRTYHAAIQRQPIGGTFGSPPGTVIGLTQARPRRARTLGSSN